MKKWISGLLALVMVLSLAAFPAHAEDVWTALTDGGELSAGNYILNSNVTLTTNITINGKAVTIDLNGYTLTGSVSSDVSIITISGGGSLTLVDNSAEKTGTITGGNLTDGNGGAVHVKKGTFTMESGTISGNYANKGGGVYLEGDSSIFTMNGGAISGNYITSGENEGGGGVYVSGGTFNMNGGTISGNTANDNGGGVKLMGGTFNMNGGTISGNTASNQGGGVYVRNATFNLHGGTISGNTATTTTGGGVHVYTGATFTMDGGTITKNTAKTEGGGIYFQVKDGGSVTISSGVIYGNKAEEKMGQEVAIEPEKTGGTATLIINSAVNSTTVEGQVIAGWINDQTGESVTNTSSLSAPYYLRVGLETAAQFYARTLTLDGYIGVNYYVSMEGLSDAEKEKYSVVFTVDGETQSRTANYVSNSYRNDFGDGETYYRFTVYLDSTQMAKTFTAELKYNNGTNVQTVQSDKYSVQTYCKRAIEGNWVEKDLCAALLNYGGYSQTYFDADTGNLANKDLSDWYSDWKDPVQNEWQDSDVSGRTGKMDNVPAEIKEATGTVNRFSATLRLQSQTVIRIYFNIADGYATTDLTFAIGSTTLAIQATDTGDTGYEDYGYYVEFEVPASGLSKDYTVTIKGGKTETTGTVTYSALAYVNAMVVDTGSTASDALENACKALYFYSAEADVYSNWYTGNT